MALSNVACNGVRTRTNVGGFTLIELMIVVVIVAILAAVALPSYDRYVKKSRRTDAKQALLDFAARQEKYFSTHNTYSAKGTDLGYSVDNAIQVGSGKSYYTLSFTQVSGPTTFSATATPSNAQIGDACGTYLLDHFGAQSYSTMATDPSLECW